MVPVEGAGAVEEFEVEGGGGLAVDFSAGTGLHGHFSVLFFFGVARGCNALVRVWSMGYGAIASRWLVKVWCEGGKWLKLRCLGANPRQKSETEICPHMVAVVGPDTYHHTSRQRDRPSLTRRHRRGPSEYHYLYRWKRD